VHCFFDESGDFGFPADRFDCYTQAAVICPDSYLSELQEFVAGRHARWGVSELHAAELSPGQRLRLCRFIAQSSLQLVVQATDTQLADRASLGRWRKLQSKGLIKNLEWYRAQGGKAESIESWMTASAKKVSLPTRISDSEFLQATLMVDLIHAALQKSLIYFSGPEWREDFVRFAFVVDAKIPGKLGAGEKFVSQALVPILGSNRRFTLGMSDLWKDNDPPHPFIANFERAGGWSGVRRAHVIEDAIDISAIFEEGVRFEQSHDHPGLQMADLAAYVARSAVLRPSDERAQLAYDLIRPRLRTLDGSTIRLVRLNTTLGAISLDRYRHVAHRASP
jgi:hypothetical protein